MNFAGRYRCLILIILVLVLTASVAADEEPLPPQAGLPWELVIPDQPALDDQITALLPLVEYAEENAPEGGFLAGLKGCMAGSKKPPLVNIADLVANVESLKGKSIAVEGIYEKVDEDRAAFKTQGGTCYIVLAGGTFPDGFGEAGPEGLPVRTVGTVEIADDRLPLVRAHQLSPALCLTPIRLARAYEVGQNYMKAVEGYKQGQKASSLEGYGLAAFAACRAAEIAHHQLDDSKQALGLYNAAWNAFAKKRPDGQEYQTWVLSGETWQQQPVRQVIAPPLDSLQRGGFWYKLVDFFSRICGGNPALGVLLLAVLTRVLIYPLTKKQLASSQAMQSLQPQIKKLQTKYKDDKQKFQEKFWELCKANKVNPLGGCLPLLVQMPILLMIYRGIRAYIIRFDDASFLWVENLAQPDIYLLIGYTISMVAFQKMTQKMNPTAQVNPQQAQQQQMMTWMMPLMFFFLFQSFPAAFILYWLGTNLVYFALQYWYMKTTPPPEAANTSEQQRSGLLAGIVGSRENPEPDGESQSYEEKKAQQEGKKTRKDEETHKRKRRR